MGSLPTLNPPAPIDVGRLVQLKNLIQAQPLEIQQRQQALQAGQLGIQEQQLNLQRQQALDAAWSQPGIIGYDDNGQPRIDTDKLTTALQASGHGASQIPNILKSIDDYHKLHNDVVEGQQKIDVAARDSAGAAGHAMVQTNNDPHLADLFLQHQLSAPGLDPQHAQMYQQMRQQIAQNPQAVGQIAQQLIANSPKYTELQSQEMTAQAKQSQASLALKEFQAKLPGGLLEDVQKTALQDYLKDPNLKGETIPVGKRNAATFDAWKAKQAPLATFNLNAGAFATPPSPAATAAAAASPTPEAALQKLDPRMRASIKQVGEYQMKKSEMLARTPQAARDNFNTALDAVYPNYSEANYDARHKMMLDYTSGKTSQQINAINTAGGHLSALADAADALKNNNVQLVNQIANKIGVAIGRDPVTTFNTIVHRVGPELAAAYIQGGGGEGERGTTAADFDPKLGPDQLKNNLAITAKLLGSKISSNENQWKQTMDRDDFRDRFLSPEAKAALAKLSPETRTTSKIDNTGSIEITTPSGRVIKIK